MCDILLYSRSWQCDLYANLGVSLKERGFSVFHLVNNQSEADRIRSIDSESSIYNLEVLIDNFKVESKFKYYEDRYDISSMWRLIYADRHLSTFSFEDLRSLTLSILGVLENIFESKPFKFFLNEEVANFVAFSVYKIGSFYGCSYVGFCVPRNYSKSRFAFTNSWMSNFVELDRVYSSPEIKLDNTSEAEKFIADFRENPKRPDYMLNQKEQSIFSFEFWNRLMSSFYLTTRDFFTVNSNSNFEFHGISRWNRFSWLFNYFRSIYQRKYYEVPRTGDSYVLFPLHFQPEATTLVLAHLYEKQLTAIDIIAKSIPGDYLLYVKEHTTQLGHRTTQFYRDIIKYPNVRLIAPSTSTFELIRKAKTVICLTSTVGWEALLLGKPVFVLGEVFYSKFKYAYQIKSSADLAKEFKLVSLPSTELYEQELVVFVQCYLNSLRRGSYLLGTEGVLSAQNIENLADSFILYLREHYGMDI